ncbi:MAG TPA: hypothetical protein PLQ97_05930 [Myxococcota bacterium]|nr:hypothetical protein [Myxococcota bacterium]HQK50202.1 hypothetical protein [Myxococcota bacterium]
MSSLASRCLVLALLTWPSIPMAGGPPDPLDPEVVRSLRQVPFDPLPKQLSADAHFVVSDEKAHWVFQPVVTNLGGALMGVGTDPNYLMAGWARSELLVLLDFDQVVVDVHALYRLAFLHAPDIQAFLSAWSSARAPEMETWIREAYPAGEDQNRVLRAFRMARNLVDWRLRGLRKAYREQKVRTFLDDPDQYRHLRDLFLANRVVAIRGDLTGRQAVREVGRILREARIPLRIYYPSNAEKYFECSPDYRENMRSLPFDDRSVVVRTAGGWGPPENSPDGFYTYMAQRGPDFLAWMEDGVPCGFKRLVSHRRPDKAHPGLHWIGLPPAPRPPPARKTRP